jgi:25S rRNA (adenine2142-N1)-methyltransferase
MLKRTTLFLQASDHTIFPALFVVLPLPCVENSRYLTKERFLAIMESLGYILIQSKESKRMAYWLFRWSGQIEEGHWKKETLREGGGRNNFTICN